MERKPQHSLVLHHSRPSSRPIPLPKGCRTAASVIPLGSDGGDGNILYSWRHAGGLGYSVGSGCPGGWGAMGFCANSCAVLLRCPQAVPCGQTARGGGGGWKGRGVHLPHNARHQQAGTEMIAGRGLRAFEGATHWKRMSAVCFDCHFKFLELRSVSRPGIWLGSQYMYRSQIMHRLKNNRLNPALS